MIEGDTARGGAQRKWVRRNRSQKGTSTPLTRGRSISEGLPGRGKQR